MMKNKPIRKTMILACICILVIWNINLLENYHYVDGEYRDGKYLVFRITLAHGEKQELYMYKIGSLMEVGK